MTSAAAAADTRPLPATIPGSAPAVHALCSTATEQHHLSLWSAEPGSPSAPGRSPFLLLRDRLHQHQPLWQSQSDAWQSEAWGNTQQCRQQTAVTGADMIHADLEQQRFALLGHSMHQMQGTMLGFT